jgi:hypothetical protein
MTLRMKKINRKRPINLTLNFCLFEIIIEAENIIGRKKLVANILGSSYVTVARDAIFLPNVKKFHKIAWGFNKPSLIENAPRINAVHVITMKIIFI